MAIGAKDELTEINICSESNLHSILDRSDYETLAKESVEMMTLDTFCKKTNISPTYVRMDVEGYEYQIISGARKTMKNKNMKFMIEFHPALMGNEKSYELLRILRDNGFETKYVVFDNPFYPNVRANTPLFWFLLYLESKFMKRKNGHLMGKVHRNLTIDDLMKNNELLTGKLGGPHILFEKQ